MISIEGIRPVQENAKIAGTLQQIRDNIENIIGIDRRPKVSIKCETLPESPEVQCFTINPNEIFDHSDGEPINVTFTAQNPDCSQVLAFTLKGFTYDYQTDTYIIDSINVSNGAAHSAWYIDSTGVCKDSKNKHDLLSRKELPLNISKDQGILICGHSNGKKVPDFSLIVDEAGNLIGKITLKNF